MSYVEQNSGLHYATAKYLGLLNDYLVALKEDPKKFDEKKLKEVQQLFDKLGDEESIDPQIQMLNVIIEKELRKNDVMPSAFFDDVVNALHKNISAVLIKDLQHVINALDSEYSQALAKIKGK